MYVFLYWDTKAYNMNSHCTVTHNITSLKGMCSEMITASNCCRVRSICRLEQTIGWGWSVAVSRPYSWPRLSASAVSALPFMRKYLRQQMLQGLKSHSHLIHLAYASTSQPHPTLGVSLQMLQCLQPQTNPSVSLA